MAATGPGAFAPSIGSGEGEEVLRHLSRTLSGPFRQLSRTLSGHPLQTDQYTPMDDSSSDKSISKAEDWKLMPQIKGFREQDEKDQLKGRRLGVTWRDLTVKGVGADAAINENVLSQFVPSRFKGGQQTALLKTIIDNSHGCVKPGEMLLVLGRPGSGCTSLLKVRCWSDDWTCTKLMIDTDAGKPASWVR